MQLDLFRRRPVEPEDVEHDIRRQILVLAISSITDYPLIDEEDPAWQRYGLGPVQDVPRYAREELARKDRWES